MSICPLTRICRRLSTICWNRRSPVSSTRKYRISGEFHATENTEGSDIPIPIYDVYFALIDNNLIDTDHFSAEDATDTERYMLQAFENRKASAIAGIQDELTAASPSVYSDLTEEYQAYCTRIATMLREQGVINSDAIDRTDEVYQAWTSESLSLKDYLTHAIEQDWVDITLFAQDQKYVDTDELYSALVTYILEQLQTDSGFEKLVYQYLILQDQITGNQLCLVLYEQGILPWDEVGLSVSPLRRYVSLQFPAGKDPHSGDYAGAAGTGTEFRILCHDRHQHR